jgi:hypothetical protein
MHESFCIGQTVRHEWFDSRVGNFVLLDFCFCLKQNVSILLLTDQVSLIERIGLHLNRFYTSQFHAKLSEFINLVRVVGQKNEIRIYLKDAQNIFDISILSVIMLHAQHFIGFKSVNALKLLKILNVHAGSAFSDISASSAFLDEIKEDSIACAYFLDCSIKLLPAVTIKTSH